MDNLKNYIENKINETMNKLIQQRWEEMVKATDLDNLRLNKEMFSLMRVVFQLGYQQGQTDDFIQMQEIYDNDPDLFQAMFEKDDELN